MVRKSGKHCGFSGHSSSVIEFGNGDGNSIYEVFSYICTSFRMIFYKNKEAVILLLMYIFLHG